MKAEQAAELINFIRIQMEKYGFAPIVEEADARIAHDVYSRENRPPTEKDNLLAFLQEISNVLNDYSIGDYDAIIKRFNKNLIDSQVESIVVTSNNKGNYSEDLSKLPDYIDIIKVIDTIIGEILNDNGNEYKDDDTRDQ